MAQLTLQVDSPSLFEQLKNVLSLIKGVKIVSDSPISRSAALEDVPNAETLAAMKDTKTQTESHRSALTSFSEFLS